jgi:hypothetical protein
LSIVPTIIVPILLIGLAGLLIDSHRRAWREAEWNKRLSYRDRRFARSQYRRRMQASGSIAVIGAALGCYPLIPKRLHELTIYLLLLIVGCVCIMLLGILDLWASRQNLRRIQHEHLAEQIRLAKELHSTRPASKAERS